jgi:hypothetical protein
MDNVSLKEALAKFFDAQNRPFELFPVLTSLPALLGRPASVRDDSAPFRLGTGLKIIDFSLSWNFANTSSGLHIVKIP